MGIHRKLPPREHVFVLSLMRHGYRLTRRRSNFKKKKGYVIPATKREDAGGIDFLVKPPGADCVVPVQITQRGSRFYQKYHSAAPHHLDDFHAAAIIRLRTKRRRCRKDGVAFVLVRDHDGNRTNPAVAWGDIKALRHAVHYLQG